MTIKFVQPSIYLVVRPQIGWEQVMKFLANEGLPSIDESLIADHLDTGSMITELAARLCYMSYAKGRKDIHDFIENLLKNRDGSVFEHIVYGFVITGVSRSLSHELVRHRAGFAYSQRSQRYVKEDEARFIIPPLIEDSLTAGLVRNAFQRWMKAAARGYEDLVNLIEESAPPDPNYTSRDRRKAIRSAARSVLPNATETQLMVTANVRAWRNFLEQRLAPSADAEIRRLARMILKVLKVEAPLLFMDFTEDGPEYSKV